MDNVLNIFRVYWRFIAVVLISVIALWYARAQAAPVREQASAAKNKADSLLGRHVADVVADAQTYNAPANVAVVDLRARHAALNELVMKQAGELSWQLAADLNPEVLGTGANTEARIAFYIGRLSAVEGWLTLSRFWAPVIRGEGNAVGYDFEKTQDRQNLRLTEKLLRLDLLRRVAKAAEDSRVARVTQFSFIDDGELNDIRERLPAMRPSGGHGGAARPPMLRAIGMRVAAAADQYALAAFLADLERPLVDGASGRALAADRFEFKKDDWKEASDGLVRFEGTLLAFAVSPEAELSEVSLARALARRDAPDAGGGATEPESGFGDNQPPQSHDGPWRRR